MLARWWHGLLAVLVLVGLVVQIKVTADASAVPAGHAVGTLRGTQLAGRVVRVLSFFTVQSNILSGIVSAQLARRPDRDGRGWRVLRLAALVGITVTGIVYSTVLARVHEPKGTAETVVNDLFHYAVPIGMVLGWLLFGPRPRVTAPVVGLALLWPVAWAGYTLVHGAATGWYPYPFVDVTTHGYARVLSNAVLVTVVVGLVCAVYAALDRTLPADAQPASARTTRDGLGLPS